MSEHDTSDDWESRLPPILPRIRATWRDQRVVFTFPPDQHAQGQEEVAYTLDEVDGLYATFYQNRRLLSGSSYSIIPSPDHTAFCRLSGEGAVLLFAELREIRHRLGIADPPEAPWLSEELDRGACRKKRWHPTPGGTWSCLFHALFRPSDHGKEEGGSR